MEEKIDRYKDEIDRLVCNAELSGWHLDWAIWCVPQMICTRECPEGGLKAHTWNALYSKEIKDYIKDKYGK